MGEPKLSTNTMTRYTGRIKALFAFGILIPILILACRKSDITQLNPILSASNERDLGNRLMQEVLDNPSKYNYLEYSDYTPLYDYLDAALSMIENQTEIRDFFSWDILIIENDQEQSAYSFPGGKIMITTGLLKYLDGEHQLVALLAHEAYYINRFNDGSPNSLSIVMQKMKSSFTNNKGLGTKVFIDAIEESSSDMVEDMIEEARSLNFDPAIVFEADEFSINMLCENYLYPPTGLSEILLKTEQNNNSSFEWLNSKPPSLLNSKPPSYTMETRALNLDELELPCLDNEIEGNTTFAEMMNMLP